MASGIASIDEQIEAMNRRWPLLRLVERDGRRAVWIGAIHPTSTEYKIRVEYEVPYAIELFEILDVQPRVEVLNPLLERHSDYEDGPIPHVYFRKSEPHLPYLCLFDPYNVEWSPSDLLADTTVPWTASYLYFYEGWLAVKRWLGPGRHPTREERSGMRPLRGSAAGKAKVAA